MTATPKPAPAPLRAPVPAGVQLPTTGRRVAAGPAMMPVPDRSVFDATPPHVVTARKQADETRKLLSTGVQGLRAASKAVAAAKETIAADPETAAIFAHEGLTAEVLKQFGELSDPVIKAFTAAPPAAA